MIEPKKPVRSIEKPIPTHFEWSSVHERIWQAGGGKSLKVLDLAAGTGSLCIPFLEKECDVTATELGAKLIRHLESVRSPGGKAMTVLNEDIRQTKPAEAAFDVVICSFILHFFTLAEGLAILESVRKSVRPGGIVWVRWFTPEGELVFGYDHFVPTLKQMQASFAGATLLLDRTWVSETASLKPDKTPMTHTAAEALFQL